MKMSVTINATESSLLRLYLFLAYLAVRGVVAHHFSKQVFFFEFTTLKDVLIAKDCDKIILLLHSM